MAEAACKATNAGSGFMAINNLAVLALLDGGRKRKVGKATHGGGKGRKSLITTICVEVDKDRLE